MSSEPIVGASHSVVDPACPAGLVERPDVERAVEPPRGALRNVEVVDVSAATSAPVRLERVEMSSCSETEARRLFDEMGRVVAAAATPDLPAGTGWAAEVWETRWPGIRSVDAYVARAAGELVGFMLCDTVMVGARRALYLQAAYIHPALQGRGIGFAINARVVFRELCAHPFSRRYMVSDMMSPVALAGWRARVSSRDDFFPPMDGAPATASMRQLAIDAARLLYPDLAFDVDSGVLHGRTGPRTEAPIRSGVASVDAHYDRFVDPVAGDTVLVVVNGRRREVLAGAGKLLSAIPRMLRFGRARRDGRGAAR